MHRFTATVVSLVMTFLAAARLSAASDERVYELRTYMFAPGKQEAVLARFRERATKLFEQQGMVNVGYFVPLEAKDGAGGKLICVLAHASRAAAARSWQALQADPEWQALSKAAETEGTSATEAGTVFLATTPYSPVLTLSANSGDHVYELRTYTTPEGGLPALDERFRDQTHALFGKHHLKDIVYWHRLEGEPGAGHTLVYILAHPDRASAQTHWAEFQHDPAWIEAKAASEKKAGRPLTTEIKSVFLAPTSFSPLK